MTKGLTKQARTLTEQQQRATLAAVAGKPTEQRDRVMLLLSWKAGLRAKEIASITWAMVCDAEGNVGAEIAIHNRASKGKHGGRQIPMHSSLRDALVALKPEGVPQDRAIVRAVTGSRMSANAVAQWFGRTYRSLGFHGCSSHSGRRTFITRAARAIVTAGGSLRDVQMLAGHSTLMETARYIDQSPEAQRRVVAMM